MTSPFRPFPRRIIIGLLVSSLVGFGGMVAARAADSTGTRTITIAATGVDDTETTPTPRNVNVLSASVSIYANPGEEDEFYDTIEGVVVDNGDVTLSDIPVYDNAEYQFEWTIDDGDNYVRQEMMSSGDTLSTSDLSEVPSVIDVERHYLPAATKRIHGTVYYAGDGNPMPLVALEVSAQVWDGDHNYNRKVWVETDSHGGYSVEGLKAPGHVTVSFSPGNQSEESPYFNEGLYYWTNERFTYRASRSDYRVDVFVTVPEPYDGGGDSGGTASWTGAFVNVASEPLSGFAYLYDAANDEYVSECAFDANECLFDGLAVGDYYVIFDDESRGFGFDTFTVTTDGESIDGGSTTAQQLIASDANAEIHVLDGDGVDVSDEIGPYGVGIQLEELSGAWDPRLKNFVSTLDRFMPEGPIANEDGSVSFTNMLPGDYRISASMNLTDEYLYSSPQLELVAIGSGDNTVNLSTERYDVLGDSLVVKLRDAETREPVEGVRCAAIIPYELTGPYGGVLPHYATTDANGLAIFSSVLRGVTYSVSCFNYTPDRQGNATLVKGVTIQEGRNYAPMKISFVYPHSQLTGTVVDENGDPLEGIRVSATVDLIYTDCMCHGDGPQEVDYTNEEGEFVFDDLLTGQNGTIFAEDRSGALADTVIQLNDIPEGLTELDPIEMVAGKPITGSVKDESGHALAATVIISSPGVSSNPMFGFQLRGRVMSSGTVKFNDLVAPGDYLVDIQPDDSREIGGHVSGWLADDGSLVVAESDAKVFTVTSGATELDFGEVVVGDGGSISGDVTFADADGTPIDGWGNLALAQLYVRDGSDWVHAVSSGWGERDGFVWSWMGGDYTIAGLPAGTYRVCFADYFVTANMFDPLCFDDATNVAEAEDLVVAEGANVTGVDGVMTYAQPIGEPRTVSFDPRDFAELEGGFTLAKGDEGELVMQLDPDLSGQWVAVETVSAPTASRATRASTVTEWLSVSATGTVTIPAVKPKKGIKTTIVAVDSANEVVGWVVGAKPSVRTKPTISGDAFLSETLTATEGTWTGGGEINTQWYLCKKKPIAGKSINVKAKCATTGEPGAYALALTESMNKKFVAFKVQSTNAFGSAAYFAVLSKKITP